MDSPDAPSPAPARRRSARTALIAAGLVGLGVAGGAVAVRSSGPTVEMAPARPVAISSLKDDGGIVTVRGRVAEVYGPMFVLADTGARALIDTGPRSTRMGATTPVAAGGTVTVQGRFHDGIVRASFLVNADGTVTALHAFGPRHGGPGGPQGLRGPHGHGRPDRAEEWEGASPPTGGAGTVSRQAPANAAAPAPTPAAG